MARNGSRRKYKFDCLVFAALAEHCFSPEAPLEKDCSMPSLFCYSLFAVSVGVFLTTLILSGTASAQTSGRFSFQTVDGGLMRLDTETGHISICNRNAGDFVCRSVADDRLALDDEITRLKRENAILRQGTAAPQTNQPKLQLPSAEELDKAMGLFERMMRRLMQTMKDEPPAPNRL
jgi:hypothetical protein